jgi:DNA-directed RNA polymerase subunit RPC12/RpoP
MTSSERTEAHCPECAAEFILSAAARKRKVQCPKCRAIVRLESPAAALDIISPSAAEFAELTARVARQEALIEKLLRKVMPGEELQLPPIAPAPQTLLLPGASLRWLHRDTEQVTRVDEEQEAVLLHNLRVMGQREVVMQAAAADESAWQLGERLSAVFRQAGWNVMGPEPTGDSFSDSGLVLAAGQCPLPKAATATYMALKAAGFPIASRLDAAMRPNESVLITAPLARIAV